MTISDTIPPAFFPRQFKIWTVYNVRESLVTDPMTNESKTRYEFDEVMVTDKMNTVMISQIVNNQSKTIDVDKRLVDLLTHESGRWLPELDTYADFKKDIATAKVMNNAIPI